MDSNPSWKNAALPEVGRPLIIRVDGRFGTQTRRVVTKTVALQSVQGRTLLLLSPTDGNGNDDVIALDQRSPVDRWSYAPTSALALADRALTPSVAPTVQEMIDAGRVAANVPVPVPHPGEPTIDQLAERDHDDLEAGETVAYVEPIADTSTVDHVLLRQLDKLKQRKRNATAEVKDTQSEIDRLETQLIDQMVESGQVTGYPFDARKATIRTDTWPKWLEDVTEAERIQAFLDAGDEWSDLVKQTINSQTLRARMIEWERDHGELPESLPESLQAVMTVSDKLSITFSNNTPTRAAKRTAKTAPPPPLSAS